MPCRRTRGSSWETKTQACSRLVCLLSGHLLPSEVHMQGATAEASAAAARREDDPFKLEHAHQRTSNGLYKHLAMISAASGWLKVQTIHCKNIHTAVLIPLLTFSKIILGTLPASPIHEEYPTYNPTPIPPTQIH